MRLFFFSVMTFGAAAASSGADTGSKQQSRPDKSQLEAVKELVSKLGGVTSVSERITICLPNASDGDLAKLPQIPFEFGLDLKGASLTDEGVKTLSSLSNMVELTLEGRQITDRGLKELRRSKTLSNLSLWRTDLSDEGVKYLAMIEK